MARAPAALCLAAALAPAGAAAQSGLAPEGWEFYGRVELEGTLFLQDPAYDRQVRDDLSIAIEPTFRAEWNEGDTVATAIGFARADRADDRRTHGDIRELKVEHTEGPWTVALGIDRVFWGKTEAVHLVDIVNQTDLVEDIDGEEKLGQPMLRLTRLTDLGAFSFFYMPYFRERTLPGPEGRLRLPLPFAPNRALYETDREEWTPAFAGRFSGVFGPVDLGLSAFHGLSRDPAFRLSRGRIRPVYSPITQGGLDVQMTSGATLWKAEAILREGQRNADFDEETYGAVTGGFEHTLYQIGGGEADLGLIAEYAWDSRGDAALTSFQNDLILGTRLTLNDTQDTAILLTGAIDTEDGGVVLRLEGERRLTPEWSATIEGQGFLNQPDEALRAPFAEDSYLRLRLNYYF